MKPAIQQGLQNLKKWYHCAEDTSMAYFICLVLVPKIKNVYFHRHWKNSEYQEGMRRLEAVFDEYYKPPEDFSIAELYGDGLNNDEEVPEETEVEMELPDPEKL
ncbi:hypothetical protein BDQ17DRAFT_1329357 [Cyathus striatus]|nr:hypothetical protein BDQ17DRAFT_1329357 [Cyathus striatus]